MPSQSQEAHPRVIALQAEPLTPEAFAPFGQARPAAALHPRPVPSHRERTPLTAPSLPADAQVVGPSEDGDAFDPARDADLDLRQGTPRLYLMRLPPRGRAFRRITFHARVTQCLGGLAPEREWLLAVAAPTGDVRRFPGPEVRRGAAPACSASFFFVFFFADSYCKCCCERFCECGCERFCTWGLQGARLNAALKTCSRRRMPRAAPGAPSSTSASAPASSFR